MVNPKLKQLEDIGAKIIALSSDPKQCAVLLNELLSVQVELVGDEAVVSAATQLLAKMKEASKVELSPVGV